MITCKPFSAKGVDPDYSSTYLTFYTCTTTKKSPSEQQRVQARTRYDRGRCQNVTTLTVYGNVGGREIAPLL